MAFESNNSLSATATSANVFFSTPKTLVIITNDGTSNSGYVKLLRGRDDAPAITTATSGAQEIKPGETVKYEWDPKQDSLDPTGIKYKGFSHVCAEAQSTTLRWIAK